LACAVEHFESIHSNYSLGGDLNMQSRATKKIEALPDVQREQPKTQLALTRVGIINFCYPVMFRHGDKLVESLISITASVDLPHNQRGVHMSRFAEEIARLFRIPKEITSLTELVEELATQLLRAHDYARHCTVTLKTNSHIDNHIYTVFVSYSTATSKCSIGVEVAGALACPCSIALTGGMSHNQRCLLSIEVEADSLNISHEELASIAEKSFSAPVRLLLKRPDEKRVVETMHARAKFVEDAVRDCVSMLRKRFSGLRAKVRCVSFESIHPYDCFAEWEGVL
jgi:GTP cyclohydrolase I